MTAYDLISRMTSIGYNVRIGVDHREFQIAVFDGNDEVVQFSMSAQLPLGERQYKKQNIRGRAGVLEDWVIDYLTTPINDR